MHDLNKLRRVANTNCKNDVFYIDWGSSGMKVYNVHYGDGPVRIPKYHHMKVHHVDKGNVLSVLNILKTKLSYEHRGGAVLSTAGTRIIGKMRRTSLWRKIRKWNQANKLFWKCNDKHNEGCRTIAGSQEAFQELYGMVRLEMLHHKKLGKMFGMASCGGSSLQFAVVGGPKHLRASCAKDLSGESTRYDPGPVAVKGEGLYLSYLADHYVPVTSDANGGNTYVVGGVNEMRAQFDSWLELNGKATNPCLGSEVNSLYRHSQVCEAFGSNGKKCLLDKYDGYISRLPGGEHTKKQCRTAVFEFLKTDALLRKWRNSDSCTQLAKAVPQWGLLSSFSRKDQLGYATHHNPEFVEVEGCGLQAGTGKVRASKHMLKKRKVGETLTSALLTQFLRLANLDAAAHVRSVDAGPTAYELHHLHLKPGWLVECESS